MTTAAATVATLNGTVRSRWTRSAETLQLRVRVPVTCRAQVAVPVAGSARPVIREGGRVVWRGGALLPGAAGIGAASADPDYVTFDVGSANTGSGLPRNEKPHEISESERTIDTMSNLYEEEHHG